MIPVSKPSITEKEILAVNNVIKSGWISANSPIVKEFENVWARLNDRKYGIACNSGTSALMIGLNALGIGKGDEVIVPEFTMISSAWAVSHVGASPVFVDCKDDLQIDETKIEERINNKTKAIMIVYIYGRSPNVVAIKKIAEKFNLKIIEDMAEAHGIKPVGDISCYSLFANKIITTGEGGICLTNNKPYAEEMDKIKGLYFDPNHTFLHPKFGYNFKMTGLQASIGLAQANRFSEILKRRRMIEDAYNELIPERMQMPQRDVLWYYDIKLSSKKERNDLASFLKEKGIETRLFFKPMSMQPMYEGDYKKLNAYKWSNIGLYLPTYTDLEYKDIKYICDCVKEFDKKTNFDKI